LEALRSLDQNAVYFAETDYDFFSTDYLRNVEGKRLDSFVFLTPLFRYPYEFHEALFNLHLPAIHPETHSPFDSISKVNTLASRPLFYTFSNGVFEDIFLTHLIHYRFCPSGILLHWVNKPEKKSNQNLVKELNEFWDKNLASLSNHPDPSTLLLLEACAHPYLNTASFLKAEGNLTSWDLFYVRALSLIKEESWLAETWDNKSEGDILLGEKGEVLRDYEMSAKTFLEEGNNVKATMEIQKGLLLYPQDLRLRALLTHMK
jgi:hypothetical protein